MIAFILGRQPEIGLAELQAVYKKEPQLIASNVALLDISSQTALASSKRLGAIVKIIQVIDKRFTISKSNLTTLCRQLFTDIDGKITLGVSYYDPRASKRSAISLGQELQSILKGLGHSTRLLPTNNAVLGAATILHNGLSGQNPKKIELNFIKTSDQASLCVGRTIYIQDIDAYTFRDRRRPRRDARNGMLPPKLAQTMINLAVHASKSGQIQGANLLDPFCGTGVVLQEAALMDMNIFGTDLNPDMVNNTKVNINWLNRMLHLDVVPNLAIGDATTFDWKSWASPDKINLVATETYLGRAYTTPPAADELKYNITACNIIIDKFLSNISKQLPSGCGLCIGVPVWFVRDHIHHLPCTNQLDSHRFINQTDGANLIYHRPDQIVGRELLVLQKR